MKSVFCLGLCSVSTLWLSVALELSCREKGGSGCPWGQSYLWQLAAVVFCLLWCEQIWVFSISLSHFKLLLVPVQFWNEALFLALLLEENRDPSPLRQRGWHKKLNTVLRRAYLGLKYNMTSFLLHLWNVFFSWPSDCQYFNKPVFR